MNWNKIFGEHNHIAALVSVLHTSPEPTNGLFKSIDHYFGSNAMTSSSLPPQTSALLWYAFTGSYSFNLAVCEVCFLQASSKNIFSFLSENCKSSQVRVHSELSATYQKKVSGNSACWKDSQCTACICRCCTKAWVWPKKHMENWAEVVLHLWASTVKGTIPTASTITACCCS